MNDTIDTELRPGGSEYRQQTTILPRRGASRVVCGLGQLAQKNGASAEVKSFGQQMVTDYTRLNDELGNAAKKDGFEVPGALTTKQRAGTRAKYRPVAVANGWISITPLRLDLTDDIELEKLTSTD
jgi:hypothetical protein